MSEAWKYVGKQRFVYFLKPVGLDGPIKIGTTFNPETRLELYTRWSPLPLEIVCKVRGDASDEAFLHNCFFSTHSHGEWFFPSTKLTDLIAAFRSGKGIEYAKEILSPEGTVRPVQYRKKLRRPSLRSRERCERRLRMCEVEA